MQIFVLKCRCLYFEYRFRSLHTGILKLTGICIFKRAIYIKIQMQISILKFKISVLYDKKRYLNFKYRYLLFAYMYRLMYSNYIDICISNTDISVLNTDINTFCIPSSTIFVCELSHLMQISVLGILISKFRKKIGISVFQKEISLSKMDISVLQIDISIETKNK